MKNIVRIKNWVYVVIIFLSISSVESLQAQQYCPTNLGAITPAPGPTFQVMTNLCTGGHLTFQATQGCTYTFTHCNNGGSFSSDPYLTISNLPNGGALIWNDDVCGLGSEIIWTATVTAPLLLHIGNFNSTCAGPCRNLAYRETCPTPPVPPVPTAGANPSCGPTFLNIMNAPAGFTYYWQGTNPTGTSTANPTTATFPITVSGTYFVRTQNNSNLSWSTTSSSLAVTILPVPAPPPAPTAVQNPACNQTNLNPVLNPPPGVTYFWQGTTPNGTSTANTAANPFSVTTSGTYYVRARDAGGCWSTRDSIIMTILPPPASPNIAANNPACISQTLSLSATGTGTSYIWAGPNGFTSADSVANITNVNIFHAGVYSVNAIALGCTSTVAATINIVVNPMPAGPIASSNGPVCENSLLNLFSSVVPGATYAWSGPGGFNATTQNGTINPVQLFNAGVFSVVSIVNGCSSLVGTVTVVVNPIPAAPVLSSNTPVCSGGALNLSATGPIGSYVWSGPNGFTANVQNPVISNITMAGSGIYSSSSVVNGCTSPAATLPVTVTASPAAITPSSNAPICEGQALNLSATSAGTGTYWWTGPNGYTSTDQEPIIVPALLTDAGTYSVYAFESGCYSTPTTVNISIQPAPVIPSTGSNSPVCSGSNIFLTAATVAGATYDWFGPNAFVSNLQNPVIANSTILEAGMYTVFVTANGCTSLGDSFLVVVNETPALPFGSVNSPACTGDIINFAAADATPATYWWTGPNGFTSTDQYPFIGVASLTDNGNYNLYTIVNGCTSSVAVVPLIVNSTPASPVVSANSPVCGTTTLQLQSNTVPSAVYTWTGPNAYVANAQNPSIPNVTQLQAGVYTLTLTVNGCSSPVDTVSVFVIDVPVGVSAFSNSPICVSENLHLSSTGLAPGTFMWSGPAGFNSSQQNVVIDPAFLPRAGLYQVIYSGGGCVVPLASVNVVINPLPTQPIVTFAGGFLNSNQPLNIQWNFNNNPIPGATLPSLNPSLNGYYTVTYTDPNTGCPSTSQAYFYMNLFVGLESDDASLKTISIYPNPSSGLFNIRLDLPFVQTDAILEVTDISGRVVYTEKYAQLEKNQLLIDLQNQSAGAYFIRISGSQMMLQARVLKN
jgi:hypothetical protein